MGGLGVTLKSASSLSLEGKEDNIKGGGCQGYDDFFARWRPPTRSFPHEFSIGVPYLLEACVICKVRVGSGSDRLKSLPFPK